MGRYKLEEFNPQAAMLENIILATEDIYFCKNEAMEIVGGEHKLRRLISSGKIRAEKRSTAQNGKWWCNASDVLRHCRNMRK